MLLQIASRLCAAVLDRFVIACLLAGVLAGAASAQDSDLDGLSDAEEITYCTNPNYWDTDGDSVSDVEEVLWFLSDQRVGDTDDDGVDDLL